ncbi:MAG: phosphotransferase [Propioniciclava sp.]|uniref:phosphotransferase n=1 Tax=Propioniciclava sp. TaxID=2038686 RepID=UPI0039E6383E
MTALRPSSPSVGERLALPRADLLLDAERLSGLLGESVAVRRVRAKPGRSLLVSWDRTRPRGDDADHGWAMLLDDPDKVAGLLRRADRASGSVRDHGGGLFSGDLSTDPRLATPVRHALGARPVTSMGRVLRYNPGRRLILAAEDAHGAVVLRIAARPLTGLVAISRRWADAGVPTLPHRWWHRPSGAAGARRATAAAADFWGEGDLAAVPSTKIACAAGVATARLHALPWQAAFTGPHAPGAACAVAAVPPHELPPALAPASRCPAIPSGTGAITGLLPHLTGEVAALRVALRDLPAAPVVPCHGDLSPDQVLSDGDDLRIIDLDRAGPGHPGLDAGTWLAWCRLHDAADLAAAFLAGYRTVAPVPDLRPWIARALLACAIDPFRHAHADWEAEVAFRVRAARQALTDPPHLTDPPQEM